MAKAKSRTNIALILKLLVLVLGIGAFCFMFADQIKATLGNHSANIGYSDVLFDTDSTKGAIPAFIGYLLSTVGSLAIVFSLTTKKFSKLLTFASVLSFIGSAVLIFMVFNFYKGANSDAIKIAEALGTKYSLNVGPAIGGSLASVAALGSIVSLAY